MVREQITVIQVVPTLLHTLLDEPAIATCRSLKYLFCGGEELRPELQTHALITLPAHTRLCNLYGPTECTIDTTFWICEQESQLSRVPIGHPIANIQVYLLDGAGQPVPIGVPGELYIGGIGVARGYLNEPVLTAQKFVPDPFSAQAGRQMYRTGDLARYRADGSIEFLGRMDGQVKIRGCRIELGEVEVAIKGCAGIEECIVVVYEASPGQPGLAAYLVPDASEGSSISIQQVRQELQRRLPDYMLPEAFVVLETLPLNSNGKVDRRALPRPQRDRETLGA